MRPDYRVTPEKHRWFPNWYYPELRTANVARALGFRFLKEMGTDLPSGRICQMGKSQYLAPDDGSTPILLSSTMGGGAKISIEVLLELGLITQKQAQSIKREVKLAAQAPAKRKERLKMIGLALRSAEVNHNRAREKTRALRQKAERMWGDGDISDAQVIEQRHLYLGAMKELGPKTDMKALEAEYTALCSHCPSTPL